MEIIQISQRISILLSAFSVPLGCRLFRFGKWYGQGLLWPLAALLCLALQAPAADDPLLLEPSDDTYLDPDLLGKPAGRGKRDELQIYGAKEEKAFRALLKFDLKAVPPGFRSAILRLSCWNVQYTATGASFLRCHALTRAWDEDTTSWDTGWTHPGGDWDPIPVGGCRISGPLAGAKLRQYEFEVTGQARKWQAQPGQNYGLVLMLERGCDAQMRFRSKDFAEAEVRPKLLLYYQKVADPRFSSIAAQDLPPCEPSDPQAPALKLAFPLGALKLGQVVDVKFEASGAKPPYQFVPGSPPVPGLTLQPDGSLKGKPTRAGAFNLGVTCLAANNKKSTGWFRVLVDDPNAKPPEPKPPQGPAVVKPPSGGEPKSETPKKTEKTEKTEKTGAGRVEDE